MKAGSAIRKEKAMKSTKSIKISRREELIWVKGQCSISTMNRRSRMITWLPALLRIVGRIINGIIFM